MKLLYNARIHTLNPAQETASALLIDRGEIVAVGGDELLDARAEKFNLGGRVVLPGLTDAHIHLQHYALGLQKIDCETPTLEECLRRVAERVKSAKQGEWILGHGWNQNEWRNLTPNPFPAREGESALTPGPSPDRFAGRGESTSPPVGGGWPHASHLDSIAPNHPVYLTAKSLHAAWANSAALKLAGITSSTPNPENGEIQRDEHGQPTGILLESAMELVSAKMPQASIGQLAEAIRAAQPILWKMGLTGVHDFDRRACFMALQELHARGELKLRVVKNLPVEDLEHARELGLRSGFGDHRLRIGNVKAFMDGALGPRTAAMFQPYLNEPENRGILNMDGEHLLELARRAADVGLAMTVHAIGDRANHEVLDAYEQLRRYERANNLPALRHRIEHVQVLHPDDAARLAQLDVIASMQPIHATSDMHMADRYWGERSRLAYAWRTQLTHGARLAFGSDAPVESPNPFLGLYAAVTRRRAGEAGEEWIPEEKLTLREAVEAYTIGAAYAAGMESRLGKLSAGYLADLIVLEKDPFASPAEELPAMQSSATMVGGEWVWRSE
ncbi:MAG: amidohydrolase [Chloroflexi bacterium]|nr:amidohydrolase [Chloroflexota bacterium]